MSSSCFSCLLGSAVWVKELTNVVFCAQNVRKEKDKWISCIHVSMPTRFVTYSQGTQRGYEAEELVSLPS